MTRQEFLQKLSEALEAETDVYTVRENIQYYDEYISEAIAGGRSETDVLTELGDPWLIARTILDAPGGEDRTVYGQYGEMETYQNPEAEEQRRQSTNVHVYTVNSWWKKLVLILVIVGIVVGIFSLITGIISLVAPILVPIIVIMLVFRLIGGNRR